MSITNSFPRLLIYDLDHVLLLTLQLLFAAAMAHGKESGWDKAKNKRRREEAAKVGARTLFAGAQPRGWTMGAIAPSQTAEGRKWCKISLGQKVGVTIWLLGAAPPDLCQFIGHSKR